MMKHTLLINKVAEKIKAKHYLEIGVYNPDHNFNRININRKTSVDPDPNAGAMFHLTSDKFFDVLDQLKRLECLDLLDIVFIDGLHHADQVRKDLINSWSYLRDGGVIILHDTNPHSERITCVPRGEQREWSGDVYKTICQIDEPEIFTLNEDYGVTVIRKEGQLKINDDVIDWGFFDEFRHGILNLKTWDECIKIIDGWET